MSSTQCIVCGVKFEECQNNNKNIVEALHKIFTVFCNYISLTQTQFSFDFQRENFPFCPSCKQTIAKLCFKHDKVIAAQKEIQQIVIQITQKIIESSRCMEISKNLLKRDKVSLFRRRIVKQYNPSVILNECTAIPAAVRQQNESFKRKRKIHQRSTTTTTSSSTQPLENCEEYEIQDEPFDDYFDDNLTREEDESQLCNLSLKRRLRKKKFDLITINDDEDIIFVESTQCSSSDLRLTKRRKPRRRKNIANSKVRDRKHHIIKYEPQQCVKVDASLKVEGVNAEIYPPTENGNEVGHLSNGIDDDFMDDDAITSGDENRCDSDYEPPTPVFLESVPPEDIPNERKRLNKRKRNVGNYSNRKRRGRRKVNTKRPINRKKKVQTNEEGDIDGDGNQGERQCRRCGLKCKDSRVIYFHSREVHSVYHDKNLACPFCNENQKEKDSANAQPLNTIGDSQENVIVNGEEMETKKDQTTQREEQADLYNVKSLVDHIVLTHPDTVKLLSGVIQVDEKKFIYRRRFLFEEELDDKFKCGDCGAVTEGQDPMVQHVESQHRRPSRYVCDQCGKGFAARISLEMHMDVHRSERPYMCEICAFSFPSMFRLQKHQKSTHSEMPYVKCPKCPKMFKNNRYLAQHTNSGIHNEGKMYTCPHCQKVFGQWKSVTRHILHFHQSGERVKSCGCPECGKLFFTKAEVAQHLIRCPALYGPRKRKTKEKNGADNTGNNDGCERIEEKESEVNSVIEVVADGLTLSYL